MLGRSEVRGVLALVAALVSTLGAGCGTTVDDVLPRGSCNEPSNGVCTDFVGDAWRTPSATSMFCNTRMGTFSEGSCPTANRTGTCQVMAGAAQETRGRSYSPRITTAQAQAACVALGGQFTAN